MESRLLSSSSSPLIRPSLSLSKYTPTRRHRLSLPLMAGKSERGRPAAVSCAIGQPPSAEEKKKEVKLWGGRFEENVTDAVERFTESISFDKQLYKQDILGSRAHATMLAHQVALISFVRVLIFREIVCSLFESHLVITVCLALFFMLVFFFFLCWFLSRARVYGLYGSLYAPCIPLYLIFFYNVAHLGEKEKRMLKTKEIFANLTVHDCGYGFFRRRMHLQFVNQFFHQILI